MSKATAIEDAFQALASRPEAVQAVLRPVLVRVMSDPEMITALSRHALVAHLDASWRVLSVLMDEETGLHDLAMMPADVHVFAHKTLNTNFEDAEEAFEYVQSVPAVERGRLGTALVLSVDLLRDYRQSLSLLALARLLRLALEDASFVRHAVRGEPIEDFLDPELPKKHHEAPIGKRGVKGNPRAFVSREARRTSKMSALPTLHHFVGRRVLLTIASGSGQPVRSVEGICSDISSSYVVLVGRSFDEAAGEPRLMAFGMPHVCSLLELPTSGRLTAQ